MSEKICKICTNCKWNEGGMCHFNPQPIQTEDDNFCSKFQSKEESNSPEKQDSSETPKAPIGVTAWKQMGIKYGYDKYFNIKWEEENITIGEVENETKSGKGYEIAEEEKGEEEEKKYYLSEFKCLNCNKIIKNQEDLVQGFFCSEECFKNERPVTKKEVEEVKNETDELWDVIRTLQIAHDDSEKEREDIRKTIELLEDFVYKYFKRFIISRSDMDETHCKILSILNKEE